jgi:Cu-processing system permease protein
VRARIVRLVATRELRCAARGRWFLVGAGSFGLLAVAVSHLGMAGAERWGISALDRTAAALLNLVLLFVPLLAIPLGSMSFAGEAEDGTLPYLVAQPVTRGEVFTGKVLGLVLAMSLSLLFGFGAAAAFVGMRGGVSGGTFGALAGGAWALGAVSVVLGALLSVAAGSRARAITAAIGAWLVLVFLCDFGVLAAAASRAVGPEALFWLAALNPLQASKTLSALAISDRLEILGPVGVHAVRVLGRAGLGAVLAGSLAGWTLLLGGGGFLVFRRRNLS